MRKCGCGSNGIKGLSDIKCKRKILVRPKAWGGGFLITDEKYVILDTAKTETEAYRKADCRKKSKAFHKSLNPRTEQRKRRYHGTREQQGRNEGWL